MVAIRVWPNPTDNVDAPVHVFNLVARGGGAPVTLYR
jgi:hypothetical protein